MAQTLWTSEHTCPLLIFHQGSTAFCWFSSRIHSLLLIFIKDPQPSVWLNDWLGVKNPFPSFLPDYHTPKSVCHGVTCSVWRQLSEKVMKKNSSVWPCHAPFCPAVRFVTRGASAHFHFTSSLSSTVVVFMDTAFETLPLTMNETLKWLTSQPILMQESFRWWWGSVRYSLHLPPPPPPPPGISVPTNTSLETIWHQV